MSDSTTGNTGNKPPYITTLTPNQLRLLAIIVARLKKEQGQHDQQRVENIAP